MGGVGGILTFMYLAYIRGCYAAATSLGMGGVGGDINVHVPCLHTWMLRCCYVTGHGWGGGDINVHAPCLHMWMLHCCYVTGHGWGGGILMFMYLAYIRGCYAAATSLGMGGVGGDINVHVPCLHTWMLRCCYVTGHGWGGGDINVHVPCLHTWMLRCCYVTGHGWGGGDINVHVPCLHTWMLRCCYAAANFWNTWKTSCRRIDAVRWGKKEANPGIDKVVTSFQKNIKMIVSLRRKRHFANFPMEFSHKKCIHLKLEKSPYKRAENQTGWYSFFILSHGRLCAGFLVSATFLCVSERHRIGFPRLPGEKEKLVPWDASEARSDHGDPKVSTEKSRKPQLLYMRYYISIIKVL